MILRQQIENLNQCHSVPTNRPAPVVSGLMGHGIGPWLGSALIIGMPQQTRYGIVQVLVINEELVCHFIVRRCAISKHLPIAREKRKRHEYTVGPQLPLPALCVGVPKAAVFGAGISIADSSNVARGKFVFL